MNTHTNTPTPTPLPDSKIYPKYISEGKRSEHRVTDCKLEVYTIPKNATQFREITFPQNKRNQILVFHLQEELLS